MGYNPVPEGWMKLHPFASITWIRFNGSAALPRNTLSLCLSIYLDNRLAPHVVNEK